MRILLTGATGFLGARLLPILARHEVLCLTRDHAWRPSVSWASPLVADLNSSDTYRAAIDRFRPSWCLHLAWEGLPDFSIARCRTNLNAGVSLFKTLIGAKVKRIVVAGSCWEYGAQSGPVREDQPLGDCGVFASTKQELQRALEDAAREAGIEYRWARIFFAYGPGQRAGSLIPKCHAAYATDREPEIRTPRAAEDFVHVDDVAQGLLSLAACDVASGVFNIGSGKPSTVGEVVNQVAAHFGKPAPFAPMAPASGFWADTSRTAEVAGWRARISIGDGLAQTLSALDGTR